MSKREHIVVEGVGNPSWYSTAARHGDLIWTAGQVPGGGGRPIPDSFQDQVEQVLDNLEKALEAAGGGLDTLIKVNTYLASLDDFDAYNAVYVRRIAPHGLPPRTTVEVARFRPPLKIEVEAVAHVR
jgi:2-iminobutanoate/2-iminopropanoate deaminase